jgi:hypothetical protein
MKQEMYEQLHSAPQYWNIIQEDICVKSEQSIKLL